MKNFKLTEHFTYNEMIVTHTGLDNIPCVTSVLNLYHLCCALEKVRKLWQGPLRINSAYRSRDVNNKVGGVPNSYHRCGCAADIDIHGVNLHKLASLCRRSGLFCEVIEEGNWLHVAIPNTIEFINPSTK